MNWTKADANWLFLFQFKARIHAIFEEKTEKKYIVKI
jgi:hypothetical protein